MAQAEGMIDEMLARKPKAEDITLSEIEQLAMGGGRDFLSGSFEKSSRRKQPE
jgi:hypothetical protein